LNKHIKIRYLAAGILCTSVICLSGCTPRFLTGTGKAVSGSVGLQPVSGISEAANSKDDPGTTESVDINADQSNSDETDVIAESRESVGSVSSSAAENLASVSGNSENSSVSKSSETSSSFSEPTPEAAADQRNDVQIQLLCERIQDELLYEREAAGEQWSVSCIDLTDGGAASVHGDSSMLSASDLKLFIMAALYDQVDQGKADRSLLNYVSDMITVSSNEAANEIVCGLGSGDASAGEEIVNNYCQNHGYTQTHMGRLFLETPAGDDNYTSADDCARLLQQIYLGQCVGKTESDEMFGYLKQQTRTGKIPAGIAGTGAVTANKTGELAGDGLGYAENDCAIICGEKTDYILCVLSNDISSNNEAVTVIQQISGLAWNALENS